MMRAPGNRHLLLTALCVAAAACPPAAKAEGAARPDLLCFAQGALPVGIEGGAPELGIGMNEALQVIDGDLRGFVVTPKPGGADTEISFVYELPALTTFESFAVPNVLETPSPAQTFFRTVGIDGSEAGRDGPFTQLAGVTLVTHPKKDEMTVIPATAAMPVRWVRVTLGGGINIERERTFFEFSEISGYGVQEQLPLSSAFSGKWKGPGVVLELRQDGVRVSGCYDGEGDLEGTVSGNLLHATGRSRKSGVPSTFVLSTGSDGDIIGVRSTNGAPFRLYRGDAAPDLNTECSERPVAPIGCGSVIHGIRFDFDSATIRPESEEHLDALYDGLRSSAPTAVTVVGYTSSEGSDAYNEDLSRRRAEAVVAAIVARGFEAGELSAQGRGEQHPIADNSTEAGRSLNRRVEVECR
ncbi:MAG: OmpA family protein [bacterium]|nr:OmpA family protein [bacterium]